MVAGAPGGPAPALKVLVGQIGEPAVRCNNAGSIIAASSCGLDGAYSVSVNSASDCAQAGSVSYRHAGDELTYESHASK